MRLVRDSHLTVVVTAFARFTMPTRTLIGAPAFDSACVITRGFSAENHER